MNVVIERSDRKFLRTVLLSYLTFFYINKAMLSISSERCRLNTSRDNNYSTEAFLVMRLDGASSMPYMIHIYSSLI